MAAVGPTRFLVDTSALARLRIPSVAQVLSPLLDQGHLAICGIVELEVLLSARNGTEHDRIRARLAATGAHEAIAEEDFQRAIAVQGLLAHRGQHRGVKIPDLVTAAVGERLRLCVLHYDSDYDRIGDVTHQLTQWVVPRGSM
jgi:predicted nucleic acid-binding protein